MFPVAISIISKDMFKGDFVYIKPRTRRIAPWRKVIKISSNCLFYTGNCKSRAWFYVSDTVFKYLMCVEGLPCSR